MEDLFDGLQKQLAPEQQEVEAGHQVAHAEDADPGGSSDEDDGEDKPEQVAEHDDLQHVQVRPEDKKNSHKPVSRLKRCQRTLCSDSLRTVRIYTSSNKLLSFT